MRTLVLMATLLLVGAGGVAGPAPTARAADLTGKVIVLDPGHGAASDGPLTRQMPNGRGGTKDCQTTGTATDAGFPEHTFTWDVALLVRDELNAMGARTVLSRADDSGAAPCIDARAEAANAQRPDAIVSIHGDGGPSSGHGFHVNYSSPGLNDSQDGPSFALATAVRDALASSGLAESTYIGSNGLYGRADLAGLNLAEYPAVLVELGNMRNADDAAHMVVEQGRAAYADAVVRGIAAYVGG
ncbi:Rv3717 family N-acetylmuramoyl-L-alanine amidase [Mycolicibacterium hodleri]|uniref:N-acetylmuramoyl-L-alanine amidase n=1 Tax=Mycolicibacterium hodleri TaxID=49897 RepID=A0A502EIW8_9MYCO|nr:Rv3717 family N-acetylmuramoyl-L-alanine amidase [Mycolicibacterium hodleri]TPG36922.1 N-acetylmuramoyl-L-alanine amidase [Mycolicibacterium hodleri]